MRIISILISISLIATIVGFTQTTKKHFKCHDDKIHHNLVKLNSSFVAQGFVIKNTQSLPFPSGSYVPLSEQLDKEKTYQFNIVLPPTVKQIHYQIVDKNKKEITDKKIKSSELSSGYHTFSFKPTYTGNYWIIISVKSEDKKDVVCAGFSILELSQNQ